jgi:MFS family permease
LKFISGQPLMRASLRGIAVINFFNLMFAALFILFAVRELHLAPLVLGLVIGAGAVGGMLGSFAARRLGRWAGEGRLYVAGCFVFTVPLALAPLAAGAHGATVLALLFAAEFTSGFGVMVLDISIAAVTRVVIPDALRAQVSGAFQAVNFGARPAGALLGGFLGAALGLQPALWIGVAGGVVGAALLLPSPLPRFRVAD